MSSDIDELVSRDLFAESAAKAMEFMAANEKAQQDKDKQAAIDNAVEAIVTGDGPGTGSAIRYFAKVLGIDPAELEAKVKEQIARNSDTERKEREAREAKAEAIAEELSSNTMDLTTLGDKKQPPPTFVIPEWFPEGYVTLLAAHGAGGKSMLSLYIAICVACGLSLFGQPPQRRRKVLVYSCEDHMPVMKYRVQQYCEALDIDPAELDGRIHFVDAGALSHPELFVLSQQKGQPRIGVTTIAYDALKLLIAAEEIEFIIIDNASDVYGANEIERAQVRAFIRSLERLVPKHGAVFLLAHVNRAATMRSNGDMDGQQYSGSTAWHNAVRSRIELTKGDARKTHDPEFDEGEPSDPYIVKKVKGNHAAPGSKEGLRFIWSNVYKVILPEEQKAAADIKAAAAARQARYQAIVLDALIRAVEMGQEISTKARANNNAAKIIKNMGINVPDAIQKMEAMSPVLEALKNRGLISIESRKAKNSEIEFFVVTELGKAEHAARPK